MSNNRYRRTGILGKSKFIRNGSDDVPTNSALSVVQTAKKSRLVFDKIFVKAMFLLKKNFLYFSKLRRCFRHFFFVLP